VNAEQIRAILADVSFPGYTFEVGGRERTYIRALFEDRCTATGQPYSHTTRKWYVSQHAVKNEIVQTALKCVLTSLEHEARERFKYRGKAIFGPHFDVDALHRICSDKELDYRGKEPAREPLHTV
jgi:hypothetical protein